MKNRFAFPALLLVSTLSFQLPAFAQGNLTPAGAPAPTMKTLDQVEARTPVDAAHTPGDASNQFIISAPGSYYLTGNINGVSGKNGISINADNVTLDLNGFALITALGTFTVDGIIVPAVHRNLRVCNGSVYNWYGSGIDCGASLNSQFDHLRVSDNNGIGLNCGDGSVLNSCTAEANGFDGISTGNRCTLTGCTSGDNGNNGFDIGSRCTITSCSSTGNFDPYAGFQIGSECTIIACSAQDNLIGINSFEFCTVKDCTASLNHGDGINVDSGSVVVNCAASGNNTNGIICYGNCLITGNTANNNLNGIHALSSLNRIDGNTANHNNNVGILWGNDLMMRNSAFLNSTANYSPAAGTGNSGPVNSASSSTNPWANF